MLYKGKKVLITGATGFKGSWLCTWLIGLGAEVTGYSLPPNKDQPLFRSANLNKKIRHYDGDIRDYPRLRRILATARPDIVFHLAAQPLVLVSYQDTAGTFFTNVGGTVNVLEAIRGVSCVKAAVIVTTDKVYENKECVRGYRENDPLGGNDPYSASKAAAEIVTASYRTCFFSERKTASIATARSGNVVGGGDWAKHRIVPDCVRSLRRRQCIAVRNPGYVRPWQYVLEPLRGYLMLGAKLLTSGKAFAEAWNFGPSYPGLVTVKELVGAFVTCWGDGSYTIAKDASGDRESHFLHLDISKSVRRLKWRPVLSFGDTIKWTAEDYRQMTRRSGVFDWMVTRINEYCDLSRR
jgi:CDP-glucose 4,6-dehydratase